MSEYIWVVIFGIVGIIFVLGGFFANYLLSPQIEEKDKATTYECGEKLIIDSSWVPNPLTYYAIAVAFLIFEVECVFLFPWVLIAKELGLIGIIEAFIFIIILLFGLLFIWKERELIWHKEI